MTILEHTFSDKYSLLKDGRYILNNINETTYNLRSVEDFKNPKNVSCLMKIYWEDLLYRSHLSAIVSLKRNLDWIDALEKSDGNFILYCSSVRGLMESTGDSFDGLSQIAYNLAIHNKSIKLALMGDLQEVVIFQELEDLLINFTHASKKASKMSDEKVYKPKTTASYIKLLEVDSTHKYFEYYEYLCEVVHPASYSLEFNFSEHNGNLKWCGKNDNKLVQYSLERDKDFTYRTFFERL
jgi:hypothetical protein